MTRGQQPFRMGQTLVVAVSPQRELVLFQNGWACLDADPMIGKHSPAIFKFNLSALWPFLIFLRSPAHVQNRHLILILKRRAGQELCGCPSVLSSSKLHKGGDQVGVIVIEQLRLLGPVIGE